MKEDFVLELGYLALAVRLKRISEAMIHGGRSLYKFLNFDIEPNWFLLFKLLKKQESAAITEIAALLHFSHPTVVSIVNKMKSRGYLESFTDPEDSRKQLVKLSDRAIKELPAFEKVWTAGTRGLQKMFASDHGFLEQLTQLELKLRERNFMEITLNELDHE